MRVKTCRPSIVWVALLSLAPVVCGQELPRGTSLSGAAVIEIDPNRTFQEMDGFGASLTDSSAFLIRSCTNAEQRRQLMIDLFDPNAGIGLSYLRQPMGSSDFRREDNTYTYDDMPPGRTDYRLQNFSISRDQEYIIPLLREALALNPQIRIMSSPWTAPAWMKDSKDPNHGRLLNSDRIYETYADYFVKYVRAYTAQGLPIAAVTLQNEPWRPPADYPGMWMDPADQMRLAICLGRKFQANGIDTKIVIWDHNWDHPEYPIAVLNDAAARQYIAGTAFHAYAGEVSAQLEVVRAHPDKTIYFTESSGGDWSSDFGNNLVWDTSNLIIQAVRNYARAVVKWNLALDQFHGPKDAGGCTNCRGVVTIDKYTGEVTREVEYYSLGHASKFVRPGARRIDSTEGPGEDIQNAAFVNRDGTLVAIVLNSAASARSVELRYKGRSLSHPLPGRSVTTFVWAEVPSAGVDVWVTTADQTRLLQKQPKTRFSSAGRVGDRGTQARS